MTDNARQSPPPEATEMAPSSSTTSSTMRAEDRKQIKRQANSCNECRRLKLRCSRSWPCTSCTKRGVAAICPMGEMRTMNGKKLVLKDTEQLHQRIQELEMALAAATAGKHHLLDSSIVWRGGGDQQASKQPRINNNIDDEVANSAFGKLTITGPGGEARFVGPFAGSEYLTDKDSGHSEPTTPERMFSGPNLAVPNSDPRAAYADGQQSVQSRFLPHGPLLAGDLETLRTFLPDWASRGKYLVDCYWENVTWMYQIITPDRFNNEYVPQAYDVTIPPNANRLAVVFLVMACGAMMDLARPPWQPQAQDLFLFGRACLEHVGMENASPATLEAIHAMGTYILNDNRGNSADVFWPVLGSAIKIVHSLGLHRDGASFNLTPEEIEHRRLVYWEIVMYDRLQAMCWGRPCGALNKYSDTKMPETMTATDPHGFHRAKYQLVELMESVIDIQTSTLPQLYAPIAKLDAELKAFRDKLPEDLLPHVPIPKLPQSRDIPPHKVINRLGIRLMVAETRLLLNRVVFMRAIKDNPEDPSQSRYGAAFIALFESATEIIQVVKQLVVYHPALIARWWFFWFHAYSSAMCLATIPIWAPQCPFAKDACQLLSTVCDISSAARVGSRARNGLDVLMRLRKRAETSLRSVGRVRRPDERNHDPVIENDLSHLHNSTQTVRRVHMSSSSISPKAEPRDSPPLVGHPISGLPGSHGTASPMVSSRPATAGTMFDPLPHPTYTLDRMGSTTSSGAGSGSYDELTHSPAQNPNSSPNTNATPVMPFGSFGSGDQFPMAPEFSSQQSYPWPMSENQAWGSASGSGSDFSVPNGSNNPDGRAPTMQSDVAMAFSLGTPMGNMAGFDLDQFVHQTF